MKHMPGIYLQKNSHFDSWLESGKSGERNSNFVNLLPNKFGPIKNYTCPITTINQNLRLVTFLKTEGISVVIF